METLKFKLLRILTDSISILEFENHLYNSSLLDSEIKSDSLFFELLNVNYRDENVRMRLKEIGLSVFEKEDLILLKIEQNCRKIINSENTEHFCDYVQNIIEDYDFDNDFYVLEEFYSFYYSLNGYEFNKYTNNSLSEIDKNVYSLAKNIIESLEKCKTIEDKTRVLKFNREEKNEEKNEVLGQLKPSKPTLNQKLFAFFKNY